MSVASGNVNASKVHEEVQSYVRGKKLDTLVASIIENVLKYRPTHIATFIIDYLFKNYPEESKGALSSTPIFNLSTRSLERIPVDTYTVEGYTVTPNSNIQGDLETYLQQKKLNTIMTSLVERLLITESNNPQASIVEYLCDDYPEQGLLALELLNPQKNPALLSAAKTITTIMKSIDENSDSDDDKDDDDENGDKFDAEPEEDRSPPPVANTQPKGRGNRRFSVSSESLDPTKLKDEISKITIHPKDTSVMQTLYQVVSKSTMLKRMLDPEERTLIVKAFAGPIYKYPGEEIIRQGDIGDVFYLLESGTVDVFVKKPSQPEETKVHTYRDGDAFGQLALMYNAPRAATCRAASEVKLWTLDRTSFKVIIAGAALRKREMYLAFLAQVPILQSLNENEKLILADALTEEKFPDGSVICQEGQYGNDFYIILDGKVNCFQKGKDEKTEKLVLSLMTGQYFGEIALLTSKPRQATVKADGEVKLLVIDRATFTRVFGPFETMLKRNMELYQKYSIQQS